MRENRLHGSEGGEARAFPTPIGKVVVELRAGSLLGRCMAIHGDDRFLTFFCLRSERATVEGVRKHSGVSL